MALELTNLLPRDRQRRFVREYYLRLATVGVYVLTGSALVGVMLLAPSFLYVWGQIQTRQARVDLMNQSLTTPTGINASVELATLSASATYLSRLASSTTGSRALAAVLAVPRTGVSLTGISYNPPIHGTDGRMALTGTAATRESLRAYVSALSALPFVSNADLPISVYAKETRIPFTITLTGTLAPPATP